VATHLYRIAQEAVNNAVRHAKPERIVIALSDSHGWLGLTILDNGVGCTTPAPGAEGLGLRTMRERASALAGRLEIRRNPRGGTRVVCAVPSAVAVQSDEARARMNALPVVAAP
jgi:signal transduction histidine kinase